MELQKKNIRFYEEQGLISPERNRDNGYREYSLKDVELLNKIKLLRRLDVSLEEIRRLETNEISMVDCLDRHISNFTHRQKELDIMKEMCKEMIDAGVIIIFFMSMITFMCWAELNDPETPIGFVALMVIILLSMIVGVLLALKQRLKEIEEGEINEASKY